MSACDIDLHVICRSKVGEEILNCEVEKRSFDVAAYVSAENLEGPIYNEYLISRTMWHKIKRGSASKLKLLII